MDGPLPQTSPRQEGFQQPKPTSVRPPYLDEDPWTSSTPPKDKSHWTRVRQLLNRCDGDTIGGWQEEINTQLIVSALLSALTGAFVIETQKNLSEDPIVTAAVLLSHIAKQLNASIALQPSTLQPLSNPPPNARAVNSLLYVSLGFSLSNVTLGLLCLQWLRELKYDTPGIADNRYPYVHSVRHTGFQKWGAKGLVNVLPLLLLSSLTCFFAGLLCHVSTTDWVVSVPVGVVLGATFGVLVLTTLLPAIVIAGCAAFHRGIHTKSGGYPPIPPFHSLQSWISLQLAITILQSPFFKKLNPFPDTLRELKHCPDWGRVSLNWQYRAASADPMLLPFLHSSANPSRFDDVTQCLFDTQALKQFPDGNPVQMKIETLHYFIERYSKELPSATLDDLYIKLAIQLVHYFNGGGHFADLGNPGIKFAMDISGLPTAIRTQLLHAVVQSHERKQPVDTFSWDFFWLVIRLYMGASWHPHASPILVIRALNVAGEYGKRHSNARMTMLVQYRRFVHVFSFFITSYGPYTTTDDGKKVVASILFHPVWDELVSAARQLPSCPATDRLWHHLDVLDGLVHRHSLQEYAPLSFDWTAQLYPDSESSQSHVSVNMDSESRLSVSVDDDESEIGPLPPSVPLRLPTDVAERDGEDAEEQVAEAVGGATILNVEETDLRRISVSSSVPASVHAGIGDAGRALQEEEEESGSSPFVPPLPPMDVIESGGEGVVDQRLVGPGLDGHLPVSRVLTAGQASSSVPTPVHRQAGGDVDVEQGYGQRALPGEEEKEKEG